MSGGARASVDQLHQHHDRGETHREPAPGHQPGTARPPQADEIVGAGSERIEPSDDDIVREIDGVRWHRCLRCDSWLPTHPPVGPGRAGLPPREEIELPLRGKPLRDKDILDWAAQLVRAVLLDDVAAASASSR